MAATRSLSVDRQPDEPALCITNTGAAGLCRLKPVAGVSAPAGVQIRVCAIRWIVLSVLCGYEGLTNECADATCPANA